VGKFAVTPGRGGRPVGRGGEGCAGPGAA
jgi:hypothetical protein